MARTSSLRFGSSVSSVVSMTTFCVLATLTLSNLFGTVSAEYTVGGTSFWYEQDDPTFYNKWQQHLTFYVGDVLHFSYQNSDSYIVAVDKYEYDACTTNHALLVGNLFETYWELLSSDVKVPLYIVDSDSAKCKAGLKMHVESIHDVETSGAANLMASRGALISGLLALLALLGAVILV